MAKRKASTSDPFAGSSIAVELLKQSAWTFGATDALQVYELRVQLATPGVFTLAKADILIPGLPTLDGFLSFVAFRAALDGALAREPNKASMLLWQWNAALRDSSLWIDFALPLRRVQLDSVEVFDCSIGLPVSENEILIPAGAFFARGMNLEPYPQMIDSLALRRRVAEPYHRPLALAGKLNAGSGPNKALDNRMYFALTREYFFYFRGDANGVERLMTFARGHRIGMGKKTTLGYGQIAEFQIRPSHVQTTFVQPILNNTQHALVKTLPYDVVLTMREKADRDLFDCDAFRLMNAIETLGAYRPPYWRREAQTQVLLYGTTLIPR
jgi:hypothetical protein